MWVGRVCVCVYFEFVSGPYIDRNLSITHRQTSFLLIKVVCLSLSLTMLSSAGIVITWNLPPSFKNLLKSEHMPLKLGSHEFRIMSWFFYCPKYAITCPVILIFADNFLSINYSYLCNHHHHALYSFCFLVLKISSETPTLSLSWFPYPSSSISWVG